MRVVRVFFVVACLTCLIGTLCAQTASLRGQVTDQSGATVADAIVTLQGAAGFATSAAAGKNGAYSFASLQPGKYTVDASAPNLGLKQPVEITIAAGRQTLDLTLYVTVVSQQVTVEENAAVLSTDTASNSNAVSITGKDLDALSDNPDELQADLQALAGPGAGPNGGSIYIDGFSGGELPPKNAIREIRINQNPFAPEYDKLGYGRIEIFTKPGTDKFRGSLGYNFATDKWNSRNPYSAQKAPFHLHESRNTLSGPLGSRASFTVDFAREWVDNGAVINGVTLDPATLVAGPYNSTNLASMRRTIVTPRIDYQLSPKHTLSARYSYRRDDIKNAGVGGLNLASAGFHNDSSSQTVQLTETAMLSATTVNETRFQFYRPVTISTANSSGAALRVMGAFVGGASTVGGSSDTQNSFELQNYTSFLHHNHTLRYGFRIRGTNDESVALQNFNGTFTFSGGLAPQLDANNQIVLSGGQPVQANISSIESYRRTLLFQRLGYSAAQIRQMGGGASQFTMSAGSPMSKVSQVDLGFFFGDEWKARPDLTVAFGLRYETQNNAHDWIDFAPRVGLAWAPGAGGKAGTNTVIRGGFGIFYDRFALSNTLAATRYNGVTQQQFVLASPDFFPNVPAASSLIGAFPSTIQQVGSGLRAPYLMQSAVALERQLPHKTTMAITYAMSHGLHQLRSVDANAPALGTYNPAVPGSGVYPLGVARQVLVMQSTGEYNQNQLIANVNSRINANFSLSGMYTLNRAMSNTDGVNTLPANPFSMVGEYGPAATDMRHYGSITGSLTPYWGVTFSPMLVLASGPPFDITVGRDLYGDGLFNARPGIATDASRPGVVATKYGLLDPNPAAGERLLSRNFGRGPGQVVLNMRVGRTFGFGSRREGVDLGSNPANTPGGGGNRGGGSSPFSMGGGGGGGSTGSRHYNLVVSMAIRNLMNHNNPGPITGNITSPLFGLANQPAGDGGGIFSESANNRKLELQTRLTF
jgi:hypothetical protein